VLLIFRLDDGVDGLDLVLCEYMGCLDLAPQSGYYDFQQLDLWLDFVIVHVAADAVVEIVDIGLVADEIACIVAIAFAVGRIAEVELDQLELVVSE